MTVGDGDWNKVAAQWTIPRYRMLTRLTKGYPPLEFMVGHYLGFTPAADEESVRRETNEEAAERLMGSLFKSSR